jgi:hypothetical protein
VIAAAVVQPGGERNRHPDGTRDRARGAAGVREWLRAFITGTGLNSHRGRSFLAMPETHKHGNGQAGKYTRQCQQAALNRQTWSPAPQYKSLREYLQRAPASCWR